jgi:hypothetical protein
LSGGAAIVAGNETSYLNGKTDKRSLYLPAGGSAMTATTCFALGDWQVRFMLKNVGSRPVPSTFRSSSRASSAGC